MNQNIAIDFIKNAQAAGLPQEQAEQFLVENLPGYKTAAQQFDDVITHILSEAGVEKTADTSSYAAGFLYEAVNKGVDDNSAIEIAKQACDAQRKAGNFPPIPNNMKKANDQSTLNTGAISAYAEGFMKQAQAFGYTEGQSLDLLKLSMRKQAGAPNQQQSGGQQPSPGEQIAATAARNLAANPTAGIRINNDDSSGSASSLFTAGPGQPAQLNTRVGEGVLDKASPGESNVTEDDVALGAMSAAGQNQTDFMDSTQTGRGAGGGGSVPPEVSALAKYLTPEGLAMIGGGAALGGGAGAMLGGKEHRTRNAILGALLGGGAGAGADYLHANPEMYKSLLGGQ